jgi:Holliday junction resolvase RusA-like endonuclease
MQLIPSSDCPNYYKVIRGIYPVAKPRMTQRDKWEIRPCSLAYWAYKNELAIEMVGEILPIPFHVVFLIPMPKSWSKKNKLRRKGTKHLVKPDVDNLVKGFLDALLERDQEVWDIRATKLWWSDEPIIAIKSIPESNIIEEIESS